MRKLSIAVLIVGIAVAVALTGCGGGGGGGGTPTPPPTGNTIVTGTVVDNRNPARIVPGVVVKLGTLPETSTDVNGRFSFNLGAGVAVSSLFASPVDAVFKVSTRLLAADQYPQVSVYYLGTPYPQIAENGGASIPLPFEVYASSGLTKDLGMVTVQFNDPTVPPPPPF